LIPLECSLTKHRVIVTMGQSKKQDEDKSAIGENHFREDIALGRIDA